MMIISEQNANISACHHDVNSADKLFHIQFSILIQITHLVNVN